MPNRRRGWPESPLPWGADMPSGLITMIGAMFDRRIDRLEDRMDRRLDGIDSRLDKGAERITAIEAKLQAQATSQTTKSDPMQRYAMTIAVAKVTGGIAALIAAAAGFMPWHVAENVLGGLGLK